MIVPSSLRGNISAGEYFEKYLKENYKDLPKGLKLLGSTFEDVKY